MFKKLIFEESCSAFYIRDIFSGQFFWTLFQDNFSGQFFWTIFRNNFFDIFFFTLFWDLFGCLKRGPKFHKDHYEMFVKIIFEEGGFAFCSVGLDFSGTTFWDNFSGQFFGTIFRNNFFDIFFTLFWDLFWMPQKRTKISQRPL